MTPNKQSNTNSPPHLVLSKRHKKSTKRNVETIERFPIFSISRIARLRYVQAVTLNCNTNAFSYAVYNANGPQTPYSTGSFGIVLSTAHQPKGWDQWVTFYNDYVVLRSTMTISTSGYNSTDPAVAGGILAVCLSDSNGAYGSASDCMEDPKVKFKRLAPNTSSAPIVVSHSYDAKRFFNVHDVKDNISRIGANTTSQPTEAAYFFVQYFTNNTAATSTTGPLCWMIIDYDVLLDRKSVV